MNEDKDEEVVVEEEEEEDEDMEDVVLVVSAISGEGLEWSPMTLIGDHQSVTIIVGLV